MKKRISIVFCLVIFCLAANLLCLSNPAAKFPKKIVILTSKAGNGHMATCAVLKDIFPNYKIALSNPIYDIFHKTFDGEAFYVKLFQNGWARTSNFLARYPGPLYFKINRGTFKKRLLNYLKQEKPDLLISVIPLLNYPAAWAAQQCKIPFLIITLDADLTLWLLDMDRCETHDFIVTVQAKTPMLKKQIARKHIPSSCIREVGCPLRKDFFAPKDTQEIAKEWNIPKNKKIILLMRGGTGSVKLVDYVETLIELNKPLHLLVCIGKNTKLIKKLNLIKNKGLVTFSIIPFTPKIPDLMAVSDLLITQPSPNVCNEAIHMKLPILIDMTGSCPFWEKATIDWIHMFGHGDVFKQMKKLKALVLASLDKKQELKNQAPRQRACFNTNIYKIVNSLLSTEKFGC